LFQAATSPWRPAAAPRPAACGVAWRRLRLHHKPVLKLSPHFHGRPIHPTGTNFGSRQYAKRDLNRFDERGAIVRPQRRRRGGHDTALNFVENNHGAAPFFHIPRNIVAA
jgi:hypothetical protein